MKTKSVAIHALLIATMLLTHSSQLSAKGKNPIVRFDPPNWWTGMEMNEVELLIYSENIQQYDLTLDGSNTTLVSTTKTPNNDYYIVKIKIGKDQKPGNLIFNLNIPGKKKKIPLNYPILEREKSKGHLGINPNDLIYLLFPDRFSNGDLTNDVVAGMHDIKCDRTHPKGRHGGDLKGISNHLDYISELGVTALWINPVLENNQDYESYHGYAATDLYKIDPRFGTNTDYKNLVSVCHDKGIKVIWDVVYNHWGSRNWIFENLPDSNWIHQFESFTKTSYRAEVLLDPYASEADKKKMADGWFDKHMPDLNQQNPHLANYLIQNSIWWIEYAALDAFRIDTYAYPDQQFMKALNEAIRKEYPKFVLFGETWVQGSSVQSWFTGDTFVKKDYSSALNSVTDFQLFYAITKGLNEKFGWEEGFNRIELTLTHDLLYAHPEMLVTFLDNHDLSRFYSVIGEDFKKYKMGISLLYTLRGIPSIYYGTEILAKNYADPDAKVREDFPGGWPGDTIDKFTAVGRNSQENEAFEFCKRLGQWRKNNSWMPASKLMQFVPENDTYVYFRYDGQHTLMCIYNGNDKEYSLNTERFAERISGFTKGKDIVSGKQVELGGSVLLESKSVLLLELN